MQVRQSQLPQDKGGEQDAVSALVLPQPGKDTAQGFIAPVLRQAVGGSEQTRMMQFHQNMFHSLLVRNGAGAQNDLEDHVPAGHTEIGGMRLEHGQLLGRDSQASGVVLAGFTRAPAGGQQVFGPVPARRIYDLPGAVFGADNDIGIMVLDDPDGFGCDPVHGHPGIVAVAGIAGGNVCGGSGCVFVCIYQIHGKSPF